MRSNIESSLSRGMRQFSGSYGTAAQKLKGAYVIDTDSATFHFLDPNGVDRDVFLPELMPAGGQYYVLTNSGVSGSLVVRDVGGVFVDAVLKGKSIAVFSSSEGWYVLTGNFVAPTATVFETLAEAGAANVPPEVEELQVLGHTTLHDGGDGTYVRVAGAPAHSGFFQSADGAFWELRAGWIDEPLKLEQFGGGLGVWSLGTYVSGIRTNTAAFNALLQYIRIYPPRNHVRVRSGPEGYYNFETQPHVVDVPARFVGDGMSQAAFLRQFQPATGTTAFIDFVDTGVGNNNGPCIMEMGVAAQGGTGGVLLAARCTTTGVTPGFGLIRRVNMTVANPASAARSLLLDGQANVLSGGYGLRDWTVEDCEIFYNVSAPTAGTDKLCVKVANATNFRFNNNRIYGDLLVSGGIAVETQGLDQIFEGNQFGELQISNCRGVNFVGNRSTRLNVGTNVYGSWDGWIGDVVAGVSGAIVNLSQETFEISGPYIGAPPQLVNVSHEGVATATLGGVQADYGKHHLFSSPTLGVNVVVTLPVPTTTVWNNGKWLWVSNTNQNDRVVLTPASGAVLINNLASLVLQPGESALVDSNGSNFYAAVSERRRFPNYTIATLPTPGGISPGSPAWVTDLGGGVPGPVLCDTTNWTPFMNRYQTIPGDVDFTLNVLTHADTLVQTAALTAHRNYTLGSPNVRAGYKQTIVRKGGGAFTLTIKDQTSGVTLYVSAASTLETLTFQFDGSNWILAPNYDVVFSGSSSGTTALRPAAAATGTLTLPAVGLGTTDTIAVLGATQTFTGSMTFSQPVNLTTTFLMAGNVMTTPGSPQTLVGVTANQTLTNKTLTVPAINGGVLDRSTTVAVGASTGVACLLGVANAQFANLGNDADALEKVLATYALPTNMFVANRQALRITAFGTTAATGNNKVIKLYFGAYSISSGTVTDNNIGWRAQILVMRTGANTQMCLGEYRGGAVSTMTFLATAEAEGSAVTIKCSGQSLASAANDVICKGFLVEILNN